VLDTRRHPTARLTPWPSSLVGAAAVAVVLTAGCDDAAPTRTLLSPTTPAPSAPTLSRQGSWVGTARVVSVTSLGAQPCGWGTSLGDVRDEVGWQVRLGDETIELDQDMANWPMDHLAYAGRRAGRQFQATYWNGDDYLRWMCQFREATLTGTLSEDGLSFEADEVLAWGPPGGDVTVRRHWTVRAR
jgi:hypothetical protein